MRAVVVLALLFVAVGALDVKRSLHRNRVKADSVFLDKLKALEQGNDWDTEKCYNAYQGGFYEHADRNAYKTAIQTAWSTVKADIQAVYQVRDWNDHISQENALTYPKLRLYDSQGCFGFNPAANAGKCQETDTEALIGAPRDCADVDAFLQLPENHDKLFLIGAGTKASTCKIKTFSFCHFIAFHPKAGDPATCKKVGVKKGRVSIPLVARNTQRPADLYAILKLVLLHEKVKSRLSYSKIEVFKQRQDAILLQVCYESERDLTGFTIDLMAIMHDHHAKISQDNGPYMQRHVGDSWIADYTKGTSYGQDLCCLWKLARSTDALPHLVKLSGTVPDLTRLVTKQCAWETGVTVVGSAITAQTTPAQIGLTF